MTLRLAYNPNDVKPGWGALLLVLALCVVVYLLWRSLNTHLGRIKMPPDERRRNWTSFDGRSEPLANRPSGGGKGTGSGEDVSGTGANGPIPDTNGPRPGDDARKR